ncbi:KRAB-related domain-containing protein [Nephila pilipes]|uniref:KRAB-related domain-containing protein n=1 Tax=Nephila pilipes TaxID=299642 RepID=A0A8X6QEJ9_NEPPI|nr:KRAB-related domain-containing protein [Nephila pilipes]
MERFDDKDLSVKQFFDVDVWRKMSDFEKRCYSNKKKNYDFFLKIGLNPQKPKFMKSVKNLNYSSKSQERSDSKMRIKRTIESSRKSLSEGNSKNKKYIELAVSKTKIVPYGSYQPGREFFQNLTLRTEKHIKNLEVLHELLETVLKNIDDQNTK